MTMISRVDLIDCMARPVTEDGRDFDVMALELGVPRITGNFLFNAGKLQLVSPAGETLVIAHPIRIDDKVFIHFAFGGEQRRICHTMTIEGVEMVIANLNTAVALARLEEKKP